MAIELCSENFVSVSSMSPRISFSQDFSQSDFIPVEQHPFASSSSSSSSKNHPSDRLEPSTDDFDFRVTESFELESFPADEFFSDGRIIPTTEAKMTKNIIAPLMQKGHRHHHQSHPPLPPPPFIVGVIASSSSSTTTTTTTSSRSSLKKEGNKCFNNDEVYEKQGSKSFWSFKRSSSCGNGYRRSLCPLPLLSRSNSTGSTSPSVKRNPHKHSSPSSSSTRSSSCSSSSCSYQKPPLNNYNYNYRSHGSYGRVGSPALNVHSANLFGLASIFSTNKDKRKKK